MTEPQHPFPLSLTIHAAHIAFVCRFNELDIYRYREGAAVEMVIVPSRRVGTSVGFDAFNTFSFTGHQTYVRAAYPDYADALITMFELWRSQ